MIILRILKLVMIVITMVIMMINNDHGMIMISLKIMITMIMK